MAVWWETPISLLAKWNPSIIGRKLKCCVYWLCRQIFIWVCVGSIEGQGWRDVHRTRGSSCGSQTTLDLTHITQAIHWTLLTSHRQHSGPCSYHSSNTMDLAHIPHTTLIDNMTLHLMDNTLIHISDNTLDITPISDKALDLTHISDNTLDLTHIPWTIFWTSLTSHA